MWNQFIDKSNQILFSKKSRKIYDSIIFPNQKWLLLLIILTIIDSFLLVINISKWVTLIEFPLGFFLGVSFIFLGVKIVQDFFDNYLLPETLEKRTTINTELLSLGNFLAKAVIVLMVIFVFAQTHKINLIGLIASLGIAGAAIAFASQKILEQILWSIVIYIDSPFQVGDYIHLPDATLGKVEEIGWRSTKIRLSGKNVLAIIPNSHLAQVKIENLSKAKRAILFVEITFFNSIADEDKALINQLIIQSTAEILGIDHQLTQVTFQDSYQSVQETHVKAQAVFYVLGAAEVSMELRKSLLEIARNNIVDSLNNYGINFEVNDKIVEITQPMNM